MAPVVHQPPARPAPPPLENGDRLSAHEFLRRYEAMPEVKKAELINGVVHMPSPVRWTQHARPESLLQTWLGVYAIHTPGTESGGNATARLGPDDVSQPDGLLRILPECGGQTSIDARGLLQGGPELVVEVAASSASIDAGEKLRSYRRAGVPEYLLWRTEDGAVNWWKLDDDEYKPLVPDSEGIVRSHIFPGLWLSVPGLLSGDGVRLLTALQAGLNDPAHAAYVDGLRAKIRS